MSCLAPKPASHCAYDLVSLGEVMLRLDPGEGRIRTARRFQAWEGGGEYNVARGLRKCFGLRTAIATALVDNEVGHLIEDLIMQGGVDTAWIQWREGDGVGRTVRNGLNFTERGFGVRGALGVSDRGMTAASQLKPGDLDWRRLFGEAGVRWLHTGGIFAALSPTTADCALEAMQVAKEYGVIVSYDLNFRPSLWKSHGGPERAREMNRRLALYVDVLIGNVQDFSTSLGFEIEPGERPDLQREIEHYKRMIARVVATYPSLKAIATTLRGVKSASVNSWGALLWYDGEFYEATRRDELEIWDRVGGGDSFASGLIYGFLKGAGPGRAVEYGAAHGALTMTTPGDTSMATLREVETLMQGGGARVER